MSDNNQNRQFVDKKRQVLQNKSFDGGQASPSRWLTVPEGTTAELEALERRAGALYFDSTLQTVVVDNGSSLSPSGGGIEWSTPVDANIVPDSPEVYSLGSEDSNFGPSYITAIEATDLPLELRSGSENIDVYSKNGDTPPSIRIFDETGGDAVAITVPASLGAGYNLTLPPDDGDSGQFLQTDGAGVTTWASAGGDTLPNNTYLNGRNAADDADVPVVKVSAGNLPTFGDDASGAYIQTNGGTLQLLSAAGGNYIGMQTDAINLVPRTTDAEINVIKNGAGPLKFTAYVDIVADLTLSTTGNIYTPDATSTNESVGLRLQTGDTDAANAGNINMLTGSPAAGNKNSGDIQIFSGDNAFSGGNSGAVRLRSGTIVDGGQSGSINLDTGYVTADSQSGSLNFSTGIADAGNSGEVFVSTGSSDEGDSGNITLQVGTSASGTRGSIILQALAVTADCPLTSAELHATNGATGSFTTTDLKTVTVVDGIITSIV